MVEARIIQKAANIIVLWSGLLADIPQGWALCDGQGGRPDLRSKFIVGADPAEEPGGGGGSLTLSHSGTAVATHAAGTTGNDNQTAVKRGTTTGPVSPSPHQHSTPALTHSVTQPSDHADIRPPFYKVAYIIKT